jgi:uncharacterized protein (TIGR03435 family)
MSRPTIVVAASCCSLILSCQLDAQPSGLARTFEVASVKRSSPDSTLPPSLRGGPGAASPGEFVATNVNLRDLVVYAFGLNSYDLSGPSWLASDHYDIAAKVPPGATAETFQAMQQALLVERFGLKFHRVARTASAYALRVEKRGPRIQPVEESITPPSPVAAPPPGPVRIGKDGLLIVSPGETKVTGYKGGPSAGVIVTNATMAEFAIALGRSLRNVVTDETGLAGKFTFRVDFLNTDRYPSDQPSPEDWPNLMNVYTALREKLGLRLETRRAQVDAIVIDQISRAPVEN